MGPRKAVETAKGFAEALKALLCPNQGTPLPSSAASGPSGSHAGAGGARSRAISDRMSANMCHDTATSAIWKVM
jgi:hypothetical protein